MSHQCDYSLLDTLYLVFVFFHVLWYLLLPPINEVWGKVIFSVACVKNSVHRGGGLPQCMLGYPLGPGTSRSRHPLDQAPPRAMHAGRFGQQAGSMHPTGMQSCSSLIYIHV